MHRKERLELRLRKGRMLTGELDKEVQRGAERASW